MKSLDEALNPVPPAEEAIREDIDIYRGEPVEALTVRAEAGDATAAYKLGQIYQYGIGGRRPDFAKADAFYRTAAAQGHTWAQFREATLLTDPRNPARNPSRAMELTLAAAQAGHPQAANNAGLAYLHGKGLPKDSREAVRLLTVAAEAGVPQAEYNLGVVHLRGDAGEPDMYRGLKWTTAAAKAGQVGAQKMLGRIYLDGMPNVPVDVGQAKHWLMPVAASGDREARAWLNDIAARERAQAKHDAAVAKQNAEVFKFLAGVALATILAPPPTYVVF